MTAHYFNLVSSKEYAAIHKISVRTAQRRIAQLPGAVKSTGNRWVAPIPSTVYARGKGITAKTARKTATSATNSKAATAGLKGTLRQRAATNLYNMLNSAATKKPANFNTITNRMAHANRQQLTKVEAFTPNTFSLALIPEDEYAGDDGVSILFYR